jgi:hypothetical protein
MGLLSRKLWAKHNPSQQYLLILLFPFFMTKLTMQTTPQTTTQRKLYPELQTLCNILATSKDGFLGPLLGTSEDVSNQSLSVKAVQANKGRNLYPELQYLCNWLNSGKRLF